MKRYGQVIRLKKEHLERYSAYHENVWPEVLLKIKECNIQNYSIFYNEGFLFAYFEYTGKDFEADMAKMAADPKTLEWWKIMEPMQQPLDSAKDDEWWTNMKEVFHID